MEDPDYVPSIFSHSAVNNTKTTSSTADRHQQRLSRYRRYTTRTSCSRLSRQAATVQTQPVQSCLNSPTVVDKGTSCNDLICKVDKSTLTEDAIRLDQQQHYEEVIDELKRKNSLLTRKVTLLSSPASQLIDDDKQMHYLTGLPSYEIFNSLVQSLPPLVPLNSHSLPSPHDQLLVVLMKLSLASTFQCLAYRFRISVTLVSSIFHTWLDVLARELQQLWSNNPESTRVLQATL